MSNKVEKNSTKVSKDVVSSVDIARGMVRDARAMCDPISIFQELDKSLKEYHDYKGLDKEKKLKEINEKYASATYVFALDNHYAATDTVKKEYKPMVIEIANQFVTEYRCTNPSEKALADLAASAYCRYIQYSAHFQSISSIEWLSSEKNGLYANYSKEADKAYRQFLTAIMTLKQMKFPTPQINVKTNTAFVAQNQQINAVKEELPERTAL